MLFRSYGTSTAAVTVANFICQNPWPSLADFPYEDRANNCNVGARPCDYDMTFSTFYCRDYGHDRDYCENGDRDNLEACPDGACSAGTCVEGTRDGEECCPAGSLVDFENDDLPALPDPPNIKGVDSGFCIGGSTHGATCTLDTDCASGGHCYNALKEFMFNFPLGSGNLKWCSISSTICAINDDCPSGETCDTDNDSIGIRAYSNNEHLSPAAWYQKYANNPGSYFSKTIDSYEAIVSGRTVYVNAAVDNVPLKTNPIYTNMFLISHTDNYMPVTLDIYDQLLDNLKFNVNNVTNARICSVSGTYCQKDSDCPGGELCDADKDKLARDVIRLGAINEMVYRLDLYRGYCSGHKNLSCLDHPECPDYTNINDPDTELCIKLNDTYPLLQAGTYVIGQSNSIWDSWNQTFASLLGASFLLDPLNEIYCDTSDNYSSDECWNKDKPAGQRFQCDSRSHMYHYQVEPAGNDYSIYANMEYSATGWSPGPSVGTFSDTASGPCYVMPGSSSPYNLRYSR